MIIKSAEFLKSAPHPDHYPDTDLPEVGFAGRSNVGKSSLINTLLNRKRLVKTSSTPGRTQLLNFFLVNNSLFFVDFPGYGYAKVPVSVKKKWGPMIEMYLMERNQLAGVVLILDMRRDPGLEETRFTAWLDQYKIPCILVATKADKLSRQKQKQRLDKMALFFENRSRAIIPFSATSRLGKEELLSAVDMLLSPRTGEAL